LPDPLAGGPKKSTEIQSKRCSKERKCFFYIPTPISLLISAWRESSNLETFLEDFSWGMARDQPTYFLPGRDSSLPHRIHNHGVVVKGLGIITFHQVRGECFQPMPKKAITKLVLFKRFRKCFLRFARSHGLTQKSPLRMEAREKTPTPISEVQLIRVRSAFAASTNHKIRNFLCAPPQPAPAFRKKNREGI
jgi:hypothetical protein